jgi:raffinose/stachyose/melibiose transport system permease protein
MSVIRAGRSRRGLAPSERSATILRRTAYVVAGVWSLLTLFPLLWMYYSSLKTLPQLASHRWIPTLHLQWSNYRNAWTGHVGANTGALPFGDYFRNSLIVTTASVFLTMAFATCASYTLARREVLGRRVFAVAVLVGLAVPIHALVLPTWALEDRYGLTSTYQGLVIPYVGTALPFAILLLTAFFRSFPQDIEEAARVDGCSDVRLFFQVVLPMARGPMAAVAILLANGFWNEFLYALVIMQENTMKTLPVGIFNFSAEYFAPYTLILAGLSIVATPVVVCYLIFQRQISNANLEIVRG